MTYKQRYLEMAETAERMAQQLAQQAAVIEQMREAIDWCIAEINRDSPAVINARKALTLQHCPEVLNKVRADAVREFAEYFHFISSARESVEAYAQRIEKGEA